MNRSIGVVMVHPGCNMQCRFCVTDNALTSMRFEDAEYAMDLMAARGMNNLVLGGGEPFLWKPGIVRLAETAHQRGFLVQAGTNGVALPKDFSRIRAFDRFVLPLESADPEIHNRMRQYDGNHHALIRRRLSDLGEAGRSVTVSTVVTAENIGGLADLAGLLEDYALSGMRLHAWHLYQFIPAGRGGARHAHALRVAETEYDEACAAMKSLPLTFRIFKRKDMRHSKTVDFFWMEGTRLRIGSQVWGTIRPHAALESPRV